MQFHKHVSGFCLFCFVFMCLFSPFFLGGGGLFVCLLLLLLLLTKSLNSSIKHQSYHKSGLRIIDLIHCPIIYVILRFDDDDDEIYQKDISSCVKNIQDYCDAQSRQKPRMVY